MITEDIIQKRLIAMVEGGWLATVKP